MKRLALLLTVLFPVTLAAQSGTPLHLPAYDNTGTLHTINPTTDAAGNALTVPGPVVGQSINGNINTDTFRTGGTVNNGIANAQASSLCATMGCEINVPPTSTSNEDLFDPITRDNTHAIDFRLGVRADFFLNPGLNTVAGNGKRTGSSTVCTFTNVPGFTPGEGTLCEYLVDSYASPSSYVPNHWTVHIARQDYSFVTSRSISQVLGQVQFCYKAGDCAGRSLYQHHRGAAIGTSDEGIEAEIIQSIQDPAPYGTIVIGGFGSTVIKSNFTGNGGNQGDVGYLVSTSGSDVKASGLLTGSITPGGADTPYVTTSDNHAVSTAYGHLNGACGVDGIRSVPTTATCSIDVSSLGAFGTFTAGSQVCLAEPNHPEQAAVLSVGSVAGGLQSITGSLAFSHPTGVQVFQGGACGWMLTPGNGVTDPAATHTLTSYFIGGSRTATTYDVVVVYKGGQNGKQGFQINTPNVVPVFNVSRVGGLVTAVADGNAGAPYNSYTPPSGATLALAGNSNSALNGPISNTRFLRDTGTASWSQAGADASGSGGQITLTGMNNYVAYCGAETVAVVNATGMAPDGFGYRRIRGVGPAGDGSLQVEANGCNWPVGGGIVQPNHYAQQFQGISMFLNATTPSVGQSAIAIGMAGDGFSGAPAIKISGLDQLTDFSGYGGTRVGHSLFFTDDYLAGGFNLGRGLIQGGTLFNIAMPPAGGATSTYNLFQLFGNNGVSTVQFQPTNNLIASYGTSWYFQGPTRIDGTTTLATTNVNTLNAGNGLGTSSGTLNGVKITGLPTSAGAFDAVRHDELYGVFCKADGTNCPAVTSIANVQIALTTTALAAHTCEATAHTVTMTGLLTTSAFSTAFATDASAVTGWGANGGLNTLLWPTANTLNYKVCNQTNASITPGAITLNIGAK